jgi:hypothetical protein
MSSLIKNKITLFVILSMGITALYLVVISMYMLAF